VIELVLPHPLDDHGAPAIHFAIRSRVCRKKGKKEYTQ
jgi:hypothetical protein